MSSVDSSGSQWIVQILFGRYRSWGAITLGHLTVLGAVGVSLIYIYLMLLRRRFNSYSHDLDNIPKNYLPVRRSDLSRHMFTTLVNELVRVDQLMDKKVTPENNEYQPGHGLIGDPGWGAEDSKVENVHFNTSIAKSYYVLEKSAIARRPGLKHKDSRSIRDYMNIVKKTFPNLRSSLVSEYIRIYETAVFGSKKFTQIEYERFMKVVYEMVAIINEKELQNEDNIT